MVLTVGCSIKEVNILHSFPKRARIISCGAWMCLKAVKEVIAYFVKKHAEFFKYVIGSYEHCIMIITNNTTVAYIPDQDEYTPHAGGNVFIAEFLAAYTHAKLYKDVFLF